MGGVSGWGEWGVSLLIFDYCFYDEYQIKSYILFLGTHNSPYHKYSKQNIELHFQWTNH